MTNEQIRSLLDLLRLNNVDEVSQFFTGFESIGHSCEFGLVQRRYGAEPISLLRWNSIHAPKLIDAIEARFDAFASPDVFFFEISNDEYILRDKVYLTCMHTFVRNNEIEPDQMLAQQIKRVGFLRDKLIADMEQAEKIFVHLDDKYRTLATVSRLHRDLRMYGTGILLYVRAAETPSQIGTIEVADDGLLFGYIGRLGKDDNGDWDIDFGSWLLLCRAAQAYFKAHGPIGSSI